jgi:transcriptional regulator with PAS, ATPase and Fis domain
MLNLLLLAKRAARVDTTIIIYGETGSGKEVIAKYIYNNSIRKDKPFIKINCGAIPENLIESEFFGYTDGSFTGAIKGGKAGIFEAANNGTLFLDEIGEMPLNMQVKLLRTLQDGEVTRIGSNKPIKVDVRIIAATNRNLEEHVKEGKFREDLYYRLNVVPLKLMPLRERKCSIIPTLLLLEREKKYI